MTPSLLIAFALIGVLAVCVVVLATGVARLTERVRQLERRATVGTIQLSRGTLRVGGATIGSVEMTGGELVMEAPTTTPPLSVNSLGGISNHV